MADIRLFRDQSPNPRLIRLRGQFTVSGTGDPSAATGAGRRVTLSRVSAGKYRVLWSDEFLRLVGMHCSMSHDSSTTAQFKKDVRFGKLAEGSNYVEILLRSAGAVLTNPSTATLVTYSLEFEDGNV